MSATYHIHNPEEVDGIVIGEYVFSNCYSIKGELKKEGAKYCENNRVWYFNREDVDKAQEYLNQSKIDGKEIPELEVDLERPLSTKSKAKSKSSRSKKSDSASYEDMYQMSELERETVVSELSERIRSNGHQYFLMTKRGALRLSERAAGTHIRVDKRCTQLYGKVAPDTLPDQADVWQRITSEERIVEHIVDTPYLPKGLSSSNGQISLNTSTLELNNSYGSEPRKVEKLLVEMLGAKQERILASWLGYWGKSAQSRKVSPGQALFICGDGASLILRKLVGAVFLLGDGEQILDNRTDWESLTKYHGILLDNPRMDDRTQRKLTNWIDSKTGSAAIRDTPWGGRFTCAVDLESTDSGLPLFNEIKPSRLIALKTNKVKSYKGFEDTFSKNAYAYIKKCIKDSISSGKYGMDAYVNEALAGMTPKDKSVELLEEIILKEYEDWRPSDLDYWTASNWKIKLTPDADTNPAQARLLQGIAPAELGRLLTKLTLGDSAILEYKMVNKAKRYRFKQEFLKEGMKKEDTIEGAYQNKIAKPVEVKPIEKKEIDLDDVPF